MEDVARRRQVGRATLTLLLVLVACKGAEAPLLDEGAPVSKAEAETFGHTLARVHNQCTAEALAELYGVDVLFARVAKAEHLPADALPMILAEAKTQWANACRLLALGPTHSSLVAVHVVAGSYRPVLRLLSPTRLDYIESELGRFGEHVRVIDQYWYSGGETMGAGLIRNVRTTRARHASGEQVDPSLVSKFFAARDARDVKTLLAAHEAFPPTLRDDKYYLGVVLKVLADSGDDATYLAHIERFERLFPGDAALDIVSLDGFRLRKEYDRLHATIDRLRHRVDDPYLDVLHAEAHLDEDDPIKAKAAVTRALERAPTLEAATRLLPHIENAISRGQ